MNISLYINSTLVTYKHRITLTPYRIAVCK